MAQIKDGDLIARMVNQIAAPKPYESFYSILHSNINKRITLFVSLTHNNDPRRGARAGYIRAVGSDYVELERDDGNPRTSFIRLANIYQVNIPKSSNLDK